MMANVGYLGGPWPGVRPELICVPRGRAAVLWTSPASLDLDHDKMGLADRHQVWGLSACNQQAGPLLPDQDKRVLALWDPQGKAALQLSGQEMALLWSPLWGLCVSPPVPRLSPGHFQVTHPQH